MKHFTTYLATVLLAQNAIADSQCQHTNWLKHKDELECLGDSSFSSNSALLSILNNEFGKVKVGNAFQQPSYQFQKDGYTYNFAINTNGVQMSKVDSITVHAIDVDSAVELSGNATVNGDFEVDVSLSASLTQVSDGMCRDDEETQGLNLLCYKKCSILNPAYPLRTAPNTCSKNGCDANQDNNAGLCYSKCRSGYTGVLGTCWSGCPDGYSDMGLYCYRWWPPSATGKDSYDRGAGRLQYEPNTQGFGCNGYGVSSGGGCATVRSKHCYGKPISYYSFWDTIFRPDTACPTLTMKLNAKLKLSNPTLKVSGEIAVQSCKNDIDTNNPACNRARPGDFLGQFANSPFDDAKKALFGRVTDMRVSSVSFDDLTNAEFSIELIDGGGAPDEFVNYARDQASQIVSKKKLISAVQSTLEGNSQHAAQEAIDSTLAAYYGAECPNCNLCGVLPVESLESSRCSARNQTGRMLEASAPEIPGRKISSVFHDK